MEGDALLARRRDGDNRRIHRVQLTEAGEATFLRLRTVATGFDQRLRRGLDDEHLAELTRLLDRPRETSGPPAGDVWTDCGRTSRAHLVS
jgi:DNA-binding MarR family transcriptional regulator